MLINLIYILQCNCVFCFSSFPGPYLFADILDFKNLQEIIVNEGVDWMIHFSALLSAIGEQVGRIKNINYPSRGAGGGEGMIIINKGVDRMIIFSALLRARSQILV